MNKPRFSTILIFSALLCAGFVLAFSSCSLFNNDQMPECIKQSQASTSDQVFCFQPVYFGRPAWHPGGEWMAAEHADSVDTDNDGIKDALFSGIWLVHAQTGQTQPLLPFGSVPAWNLAVEAGGSIYTVEIHSLEPARYDSASLTLVTDFNAAAFSPTWSSDGEWIAFATNYEDPKGTYGIVKKKLGEDAIIDITKNRRQGAWRSPNWSKIESKIVHFRYMVGVKGPEIFTMDTDGMQSIRLTTNGDNYSPEFSPDGRKILYIHHMPFESHIVVMNADGSNKKVISDNYSRSAAWSPDGKKIVYTLANQYEAVPGNGQLWIMESNGKNKRQLTHFIGEIP